MNVKTYPYVKYIATLGSIFLFTAPLLGFLQQWKNIFSDSKSLITTLVVLTVAGILSIGSYIWLRLFLKTKSPYTYDKKDNNKLFISIGSYVFGTTSALIYVIISIVLKNDHKIELMIVFGPLYLFVWIGMIVGAIYESLSRINEQIKIYQLQQEKIKEEKKKQRNKIIDENDEEKLEKELLAASKRTSDAEKLLNKDIQKKVDKKDVKKQLEKPKKVEIKTETEEIYNPFMDQKLNDELKKDKEFNDWLHNKNKKK